MIKDRQFAVIGMGQFGEAIARSLSSKGAQVMAIDLNPDRTDAISSDVTYAVTLDATDKKALASQEIQKLDAVVIAIGTDFEALLLCAVNLIELGCPRIMARANGKANQLILERLGIEEIFEPALEIGALVAKRVVAPNLLSYMNMPDGFAVAEINPPEAIVGLSLDEIDLQGKYKISLVTIKRSSGSEASSDKMHVIGVPAGDTQIQSGDHLVLFGHERDFRRLIKTNT